MQMFSELPFIKLRRLRDIRGFELRSTDGEVGKLYDILFDDLTLTVRYLVMNTENCSPEGQVLVSSIAVDDVDDANNEISIQLSCNQIRHSPVLEKHQPVTPIYEIEYFRYYDWPPYWSSSPFVPPLSLNRGNGTSLDEGRDRHMPYHICSAINMIDFYIVARDGKFGHVRDVVIDEKTWMICYLEVDAGEDLPGRYVLLETDWINSMDWSGKNIMMELDKEVIRSAPFYDPGLEVSPDYRAKLHEHYARYTYRDRSVPNRYKSRGH